MLRKILGTCWSARPWRRPANAEMRHALELRGLSHRFDQLLRDKPLRLLLDFSDTLLGRDHLRWLALPAWADSVESLTLRGWRGSVSSGDGQVLSQSLLTSTASQFEPSLLLTILLANQRGSLLRLYGFPMRSNTRPSAALDLTALKLEQVGLAVHPKAAVPPSCLPPTLVSICYYLFDNRALSGGAYASTAMRVAEVLPNLAHVSLTGSLENVALWPFTALIGKHIAFISGQPITFTSTDLGDGMFHGAASVHVYAPSCCFNVRTPLLTVGQVALSLAPDNLDKAVFAVTGGPSGLSLGAERMGHNTKLNARQLLAIWPCLLCSAQLVLLRDR